MTSAKNVIESGIESMPYRVRISARSQRVYIKMTPLGEVEVIVPRGFDQSRIPGMILQRRDWLAKARARLQARWASAPEQHTMMPEQIHLRAVNECWQVEYQPHGLSQCRLQEQGGKLYVRFPQQDRHNEHRISQRLQQWLSNKARTELLPWLDTVSEEIGLAYARACIRSQKTRWGSCSSRGVLNLNRNLMFLPPELVRYLFIHELCHTRQMNHSAAFWAMVAEFEPAYRQRDRELGQAVDLLPLWVHVG